MIVPPIDHAILSRPALARPAYDATSFSDAVRQGIGADGRSFRAIMPRYRIDASQAAALWDFLAGLATSERRGVEATRIRIGVDLRAGKLLYDRLSAAIASGPGNFHGRKIELIPISKASDIESQGLFALLFAADLDLRAKDGGLPLLFPMAALDDDVRPDEVRSLSPSRRDQAEALLKAAPAHGAIVADAGGRALLPVTTEREIVDPEEIGALMTRRFPPDLIILIHPSGWARLEPVLSPTTRIHAIGPEIAPVLSSLTKRGVPFVITDPSAGPNVDVAKSPANRFATTAAALLAQALVAAGRDITRGGLLRAFDTMKFDGSDWPSLDYARYPRTGRRSVQLIRSRQTP